MTRKWHDQSASARGYGHAWRKLRKEILLRDKGLCQECLRLGRLSKATIVDHITPKAKGGTDDPDNLQSLCDPCNEVKTTRDNGGKPKLAAGDDGWPVADFLDRGGRAKAWGSGP